MKIKEYLHIIAQQQQYIIQLLEQMVTSGDKKPKTTVYNFPTANTQRTKND